MTEFVGPDSAFGFGWRAFATYFELLHLLDNVVDRCRACRIALIVTPWYCAVGYIVGEYPLGSFQGRRPTMDGTMVGWRMNAAVRIAEGNKTHEPLDVIRPDIKKLAASKSSRWTPKFNGEAALKFHEATKVGVMLLLVWLTHPSASWSATSWKRNIKKEFELEKNCQKNSQNAQPNTQTVERNHSNGTQQ